MYVSIEHTYNIYLSFVRKGQMRHLRTHRTAPTQSGNSEFVVIYRYIFLCTRNFRFFLISISFSPTNSNMAMQVIIETSGHQAKVKKQFNYANMCESYWKSVMLPLIQENFVYLVFVYFRSCCCFASLNFDLVIEFLFYRSLLRALKNSRRREKCARSSLFYVDNI